MQDGQIEIYIPSFCLAESIKLLESVRAVWRGLAESLRTQLTELTAARSLGFDTTPLRTLREALVFLGDEAEARLWLTLEQVSQHARLIEISHESIVRSREYRDLLKIPSADAMVLAAMVHVLEQDACRAFMSKNTNDFDTPALRAFFEEKGITYYPSPAAFLRAFRSRG